MGNLEYFSSSEYQDTRLWKVLTKKFGYTLIKNNLTGDELEKHVVSVNCNRVNQGQFESYAQRIKNGDKFAVKCVNVLKQSQNNFCQGGDIIIVMTERITRFADIKKFEKSQHLEKKIQHSFKQALICYRFLIKKYDKFQVTSHHIGFNKDGEVKMWINKEFGINCVENPTMNYIFQEDLQIKKMHRFFTERLIQKDYDFEKILQNCQKPLNLQHIISSLELKDRSKISLHKPNGMKATLHNILTKIESSKCASSKVFNKQNTQSHQYLKVSPTPYYITITPTTSQQGKFHYSKVINTSHRQTKSWLLDKSSSKIEDFSSNNTSNNSISNNLQKRELKKCSSSMLEKEQEKTTTLNLASKFKMHLHRNKIEPFIPKKQPLRQNSKFLHQENRLSLSNQLKKKAPTGLNKKTQSQMQAKVQDFIIKVDSLLVIQNEEDILKASEDKNYDNSIMIESEIVRGMEQPNKFTKKND